MADTSEDNAAAQTQAVMEVSAFANWLRRVVPFLLEDVEDTPAGLVAALKERMAIDCMKKFISDSQVSVILVQRIAIKGMLTYNV